MVIITNSQYLMNDWNLILFLYRSSETKQKTMSASSGQKTYRNYTNTDLIEAARLVKQNNISIYRAAKDTGVPWSSLKRYLSENGNPVINTVPFKKMGRPFALTIEQEHKVFNYIIKMQELGFGLTVNQIKVIAFDVADACGRGHYFDINKRRASKKWWKNFKTRYGLTLRVPENLSAYRVSMANPAVVNDYFHKLSNTILKLNIKKKLKITYGMLTRPG